jgi:hypothetical protein
VDRVHGEEGVPGLATHSPLTSDIPNIHTSHTYSEPVGSLDTEGALFASAREHAHLGLPLGPTRFRNLKRVLARALWITNRHQVAYNDAVLLMVERMRRDSSRVHMEVMQEIAAIRTELARFAETDAERASATGAALGRLDILLESIGGESPDAATTGDSVLDAST